MTAARTQHVRLAVPTFSHCMKLSLAAIVVRSAAGALSLPGSDNQRQSAEAIAIGGYR